jgi:hypothetical protein
VSNLRVLLRGVETGIVILQCPEEDNGQWEPRGKQTSGALCGRLRVVYARKRMEKKHHDAVLVGGTPAQLRRMAEGRRRRHAPRRHARRIQALESLQKFHPLYQRALWRRGTRV